MKTKNNVQKATTRLLALATILIVTGLSVHAQNLGKSSSVADNLPAFAMVDNSIESNSSSVEADVYVSNFVEETEKALKLEDWMTDRASFDVYSQYYQLEQEGALEVEDWMIDETTFNHWSFQFTAENESPLELEDWMSSDEVWSR
ncbi:hypothetical protein [uncultured Draconibacterium sp.]|uniref:hypothetical protein n=1 Tax=uncultured Draconibacterium sp. TaxID=1573823 RepID=UPI0025D523A7|nr:hypothetical protein [uncultured Draconibacterium sp.]